MRRPPTRPVVWLTALLAALLLAPSAAVLAQDATPGATPAAAASASPLASPGASPVASGEVIRSVPRAEVERLVRETYGIEEPQRQGGTVVVGQVGDVTTLNPMLSDDGRSNDIVFGFLYETLVGGNVVDGQISPALADSYEIAADGVTYTFKLNPDAAFHDGTDVTADDVVFSFDRRLDPATGGSYQSTVAAQIASYRAIDADTFELVANDRIVTFLFDTVPYVPIIPRHIWESVPTETEAWGVDPGSTGEDPARVVGTGPFKFESREEGVQITLARNDDYYTTAPALDRVIFQVFEDSGTAVQALKTGQVDIVDSIDFQEVDQLRATGQHTVEVYPTFQFNWFVPNQRPEQSPFFTQREVRQALMYGIDRDEINESIFFGYGERAIGTQPPLSFAYAPDRIETDFVYDPERAAQLLDQSGWVDSNGDGTRDKDGVEFEFDFVYFAGVSSFDELAAYLQQEWGKLGLGLTPRPLSDDAFFPAIDAGDFDIAFYSFQFDPSATQGIIFRCDAQENGFNAAGYCNPEYDRLDDQQLREFEPEARRELLIQLSNIANEDQAAGIFRFIEGRTAFNNRLNNYRPNGYGDLWSMAYVWVAE